MILTSARVGVAICGCLHETIQDRLVQVWRCQRHADRFVRVQAMGTLRRCESCRRRRVRWRVTFGDGARWLVCSGCAPEVWR